MDRCNGASMTLWENNSTLRMTQDRKMGDSTGNVSKKKLGYQPWLWGQMIQAER